MFVFPKAAKNEFAQDLATGRGTVGRRRGVLTQPGVIYVENLSGAFMIQVIGGLVLCLVNIVIGGLVLCLVNMVIGGLV